MQEIKSMPFDYVQWVRQLKSAGIPQEERLKLMKIMMEFLQAGTTKDTIEKLLSEITKNSDFKASFLDNPKDAMCKLGI
jgi:uncharacterized tellurite resistance protein B-like protein